MDLLLDSHVILWSIEGDPRLPAHIGAAIEDGTNRIFISTTSLWELGIKLAQKRLHLPGNGLETVIEFMQRGHITLLSITLDHVRAAAKLPFHHGDPFDRMLVAQANVESMRLVTGDTKISTPMSREEQSSLLVTSLQKAL